MTGASLFERMQATKAGQDPRGLRARGRFVGLETQLIGDRLETAHRIAGTDELPRPGAGKELQRPE